MQTDEFVNMKVKTVFSPLDRMEFFLHLHIYICLVEIVVVDSSFKIRCKLHTLWICGHDKIYLEFQKYYYISYKFHNPVSKHIIC